MTDIEERDRLLREAGFAPGTEIAKKLGINRSTLFRWVEKGEVEGMMLSGKRYVRVSMVITKVTPAVAKIVGLVSE